MVDLLESGSLCPPLDLATDARAVFDAISAPDICDPQESPLKSHLISIRDRLQNFLVQRLYWCDTRDMAVDGLTKGRLDRAALVAIMGGNWKLTHSVEITSGKQ